MTRISIVGFLIALIVAGPALSERFTVQSRGATIEIVADVPDRAPAVVLAFEGGGGIINGRDTGFAVELLDLLPDRGIGVAAVDAPSDQRDFMGGMSPRFRGSVEHLQDMDAVLATVRERFRRPVWVFGISMGSRSAAYLAVKRSRGIDGLILASSSTRLKRGRSITEFGLEAIRVPLLTMAHSEDRCRGTPPLGARLIAAAAVNAPRKLTVMLTGGYDQGKQPCGLRTPHVFNHIEDRAADAIADFILAK